MGSSPGRGIVAIPQSIETQILNLKLLVLCVQFQLNLQITQQCKLKYQIGLLNALQHGLRRHPDCGCGARAQANPAPQQGGQEGGEGGGGGG